jgi:hypothetical protein
MMTLSIRSIILIASAAILILLGVAVASALYGPRLFKEQQKVETKDDQLSSKDAAAAANAAVAQEAQQFRLQVEQSNSRLEVVVRDIRDDPGSSVLLPAASAQRLRDHDAFLCEQSPELCADSGSAPGSSRP